MSSSEEKEEQDVVHFQNQRAASPETSLVSMKSDESMGAPHNFCDETVTFNPRWEKNSSFLGAMDQADVNSSKLFILKGILHFFGK